MKNMSKVDTPAPVMRSPSTDDVMISSKCAGMLHFSKT
jgi:hypothetical protein